MSSEISFRSSVYSCPHCRMYNMFIISCEREHKKTDKEERKQTFYAQKEEKDMKEREAVKK